MCMRSKYGPGGEFDPNWCETPNCPLFLYLCSRLRKPSVPPVVWGDGGPPPPGGGPQPPDDGPPEPPIHKPGAWRHVHPPAPPKLSKRQKRAQREAEEAAQAAAAAAAGPSADTKSWATWQRKYNSPRDDIVADSLN